MLPVSTVLTCIGFRVPASNGSQDGDRYDGRSRPRRVERRFAPVRGLPAQLTASGRVYSVKAVASLSLNPSYTGPRRDVARLVPDSSRCILDFGCSNGTMGANLKAIQPDALTVHGVELDEDMAEIAREKLDQVVCGNLNELNLRDHFEAETYDCMIFADVLEHLVDPWSVLGKSMELLQPGGYALISIPNIRHYSTLINLIFRGYWPYRDRGIHDRTHMRWFTLRNVRELVKGAGLEIIKIKRNCRILERPNPLNAGAKIFTPVPIVRDFLTFQYLVLARKP